MSRRFRPARWYAEYGNRRVQGFGKLDAGWSTLWDAEPDAVRVQMPGVSSADLERVRSVLTAGGWTAEIHAATRENTRTRYVAAWLRVRLGRGQVSDG